MFTLFSEMMVRFLGSIISIDWENDQIHIDHKVYADALQEGNPIVITDQMKTESSRRTLPLIPYVKEELLRHRKQLEANRKAFRNGYSKKWLNCVCVDSLGNLIIPDKLTQRFGNLLKTNGLRHIRFHDLRHPYVKHTTKKYYLQKQKSQTTIESDSLGLPLLYTILPIC